MALKDNIRKESAKPQRKGLAWLCIISIIFMELLAYTWVRTESTHTVLRISKAKERYAGKTAYHKALIVEKERLKSDERITRIAKSHLNLSADTYSRTIYFSGEPR